MPSKPQLRTRQTEDARISIEAYLKRDPEIQCAIIDAAAALFRMHGFANVRMQDIGGSVGLSKAGLYHHCPSKDQILADIVRLCGELLAIQLKSALEAGSSPIERLRIFVESRMVAIARYQDLFTVIWQERPFINRSDFTSISKRAEAYRASVRQLIKQAKDAGQIATDVDPHLLMLALDGMTGWAYLWYRRGGAQKPAQIGEAFWAFISKGILRT